MFCEELAQNQSITENGGYKIFVHMIMVCALIGVLNGTCYTDGNCTIFGWCPVEVENKALT